VRAVVSALQAQLPRSGGDDGQARPLHGALHTTITRWVHHYAPEFERRWDRFAQPAGAAWRVDETYVKVHGEWVYLYRAVDRAGNTVDFRLSPKRDVGSAKAFFRKAIKSQGSCPRTVTLDGCRVAENERKSTRSARLLPLRQEFPYA
jgi:transposase-like protein